MAEVTLYTDLWEAEFSSSQSSSSSSESSSSSSSMSSSSSSSESSSSSSESSSSSSSESSSSSSSESSSSSSESSSSSAKCPRQFGGNWQRKLGFDGTNYWRARYDITNDRIICEWIAQNNMGADNWTENENARIDASGFDASVLDADFTIRYAGEGIPLTIVYSDGVDVYIAESDEATATTWSWENTTKVFDGVSDGGAYQRVNLASDRNTGNNKLWVTSKFDDTSNEWVKARKQTTSLDITGWGAAEDVSVNTNTDFIYGQSVRSVGETGAAKTDMFFVGSKMIIFIPGLMIMVLGKLYKKLILLRRRVLLNLI